jgi:prepilin-type N-terminal cleavage/methylation domain-containing protein
MKKTNKGFTLIELLVVIAIIGILSAVVLASLNTARNKGKDASAKASVESIRASAEIYYNSPADVTATQAGGGNKYYVDGTHTVCQNPDVVKLLAASQAQAPGTQNCTAAAGGATYTAYQTLNDATFFCVDSTGFAGNVGTVSAAPYSAGVTCK